MDYTFEHIASSVIWHKSSNYLINLSVADEPSLKALSAKLCLTGIKVTEFREPDLDNQLTAIAFMSDNRTKKLTSGLPLALKQFSTHFSKQDKDVNFTKLNNVLVV